MVTGRHLLLLFVFILSTGSLYESGALKVAGSFCEFTDCEVDDAWGVTIELASTSGLTHWPATSRIYKVLAVVVL